jgi:glycerol-3-phosphate dehydrogenase
MKRTPEALGDSTFDLLILGGGITGAGTALDATLRGLRVALIDKGDFASGTSSESSKLVHGGLRYLENRRVSDIRLVYEALHERQRLLHNAPHLVRPLHFIIPFYQTARVGPWMWRIGLTLYDLLAGRGNIRRSRSVKLRDLRAAFPGLNQTGLVGGAQYSDARMDDARLCIEVLCTAARHGAVVANYMEAISFEKSEGRITGVRVSDRLGGGECVIRARQVVNATGPWVDEVCKLAGDGGGPYLNPTKGVHIVAANPGLSNAFLLLHPGDGRVLFVIPWLTRTDPLDPPAEFSPTVLIGTTDTQHDGPADEVKVTGADIAYLLDAYNHYFSPALKETDILGSFAGLRPLIRARPGEPSARSREFRIFTAPSGLLTVAGGKYTTYRHMAEMVVDAVTARLGTRRPCNTRDFRLDGAPEVPWPEFASNEVERLRRSHRIAAGSAWHLVDRYGRCAADVAACIKKDARLAEPVVPGWPDIHAEFVYQREHEMAVNPADFLMRRTRLGLVKPSLLETQI